MSASGAREPEREDQQPVEPPRTSARREVTDAIESRWWSARRAADHVGAGPKEIYRAVRVGRLRAVRLNRRGDIRTLREWVDEWMDQKRRDDFGADSAGVQSDLDVPRRER
jgi:hypothetical protein